MKKKQQQLQHDNNKDLQIIKAVAQAWHSRSATSTSTNEFHAYPCPRNFESKPSRFKLEAMSKQSVPQLKLDKENIAATPNWDFAQSLWDSYELVTLAKKLETSLVFDHPFSSALQEDSGRAQKRCKESKNSLRNFLKRVSSRRFNEADIPRDDKNAF